MNKVDFLLTTPFRTLSDQEKLVVTQMGPDHPHVSITQKDKSQSRSFNPNWYERKSWLTASENKKTIFCFSCLLFGGDVSWTVNGLSALKHLSERVKSHEISSSHIGNTLKLKRYGKVDIRTQIDEGHRISVIRHNELVRANRHILNRIIDCLKFCGKHEIAVRGHIEKEESVNRGIFLDLLNEFAKLDNTLYEHLEKSKVNKFTSAIIQNELLDCMYQVYQETLIEDVNKAMFVSVQADESSDVSNKTQLVIVLRLVRDSQVVEHFHGFQQLTERSAYGITQCILQALEQYNVKDKLISQAYDGGASFRGAQHGVQKLVRDVYPYAYFVHCYAHQLNLIMQQVCSTITAIRIFFANLSAFSSFFSLSSKRTDLLNTVCHRRLPRTCQTRWNFQSRVVSSVFECKEALIECFEIIQEDGSWDSVSIREATGLKHFLEDEEFNFFLNFFSRIMPLVEMFYNILQKRVTTVVLVKEHLRKFCDNISNIRNEISDSPADGSSKCNVSNKRKLSVNKSACVIECCDIIIQQAEERFGKTEHLECFNLVNPKTFGEMKCKFPEDLCNNSAKYYPFIEAGKLKSELRIVYSSEEFKNINSVSALYSFLIENDLEDTFSETLKMSNIVLTTPVATAESERCFSTLKRVKTYLRNKMGQSRLNALAMLAIEKEYIANIANFNDKVTTKFAELKNRRAEFMYK